MKDIGNVSENQKQTADIFGYKWSKRDTFESEASLKRQEKWMIERYCSGALDNRDAWFTGEPKVILDAGCGAAMSALQLFGKHLANNKFIGVDISEAVWVAQERFREAGYDGEFYQCDLNAIPVPDESVDIIFSEGVLHHTDSVEDAINALTAKLKSGGRFLFYVYRKKGPVREFTDDYIRQTILPMNNDEAWEALRPLTRLGIALGELNVTVDVPEDIPMLGIKKGPMDLQRLIYWHVCKMYYDPNLNEEEMNHINFDWFRPLNCIRSTAEEIRKYCDQAGLDIEMMNSQESGFTVVAVKR